MNIISHHIRPSLSPDGLFYFYEVMKYIELSKQGKHKGNHFAIVDDEYYDELNKYRWRVQIRKHTKYAVGTVNNKNIFMHRFIVNPKNGFEVDHINNNGIDNRLINLRECTRFENCRNKTSAIGSTSKYLGVTFIRNKLIRTLKSGIKTENFYFYWCCQLKIKNKLNFRKVFKTEIEAAKEYDKQAKIYYGEFANLNFPIL